jgi:hypothetical protein
VNIPGTTKVKKTARTVFPEITSRAPSNELLWLGCMKAIEERGVSGFLYTREGAVREIRDVKMDYTPPPAS